MSIQAAYMVPHPPMIVPSVGRGSEKQVEATIRAYRQVADDIAAVKPDTIIIASPHAELYADYFHISPGKKASGSFARFGAREPSFHETYDTELVSRIGDLAGERGFPAGPLGERDRGLDHGTTVPLYFIRQKYHGFSLVRLGLSGLPLTKHYELGQIIQEAVNQLGRKAVFVASGDLSHKLQEYGPYGYAPEGPRYDERIMDVCSRAAFGELFDFEESFCEKAAECGHRSFVIMAGALDGLDVEARQLSHEDVTGVGYGICIFKPLAGTASQSSDSGDDPEGGKYAVASQKENPDRQFLRLYLEKEEAALAAKQTAEDPYVRLARQTLNVFMQTKRRPRPADVLRSFSADGLPDEMLSRRAGTFVSLHKHDRLRGCIGTIQATTGSIAEEIVQNAVSAASEDPRFDPVEPEELKWLDISVDVLGDPEPIDGPDQLDVKRYGVIVTNGWRRGLLLPDLDGVDTVEEQIAIARRKAGIPEKAPVRLQRFEVIRHH